jgi:hypothetical protein
MNRETMSPAEARAALDSNAAARAHLAALGMCPPWRHAAFGAIMALLVGGIGFETQVQTACTVLALGGIAFVASYDRRRYGVFINGYRKGATLKVSIGLLVGVLALMMLQIYLRDQHASTAVHLWIALAAFVFSTWGSVIWGRVFRREMERGA